MTDDATKDVPIVVRIVDTNTGEAVEYSTTGWFSDGVFEEYIWAEGNFACDCNRGDFFDEAAGRPDTLQPCGDTRFRVEWIKDAAGVVLYADNREDQQ